MKKRIDVIFGTRPETIKLAPVVKHLERYASFRLRLIFTGQHRHMVGPILKLFGIIPDIRLDVMSYDQPLTLLHSRICSKLDTIFRKNRPDLVLIQGDSSSAFSSACAAFYHHIPIAHIEAGLRSGDRLSPFPEEMHRCFISSVSTLHFAPSILAAHNLEQEGVDSGSIFISGNSIVDALSIIRKAAGPPGRRLKTAPDKRLILVAASRKENIGRPIQNVCRALKCLSEKRKDIDIVFLLHVNPSLRRLVTPILRSVPGIHLIEPMPYLAFIQLLRKAYVVMTDSGGIQEEAPSLGIPALVIRSTTERPETVISNRVRLIGTEQALVYQSVHHILDNPAEYASMQGSSNPYGDGRASERIADYLKYFFSFTSRRPQPYQLVK